MVLTSKWGRIQPGIQIWHVQVTWRCMAVCKLPKDVLKMASGLISPIGHRHQLCNDALMDIVVEAEIELSDLVWWKIENLQWMLYPFSEASNNFFTRASILLSSRHLFIWSPMVGWRPHSYSAQWGQDDAISAISACRGNGPRHHGHRYLRRYVVF